METIIESVVLSNKQEIGKPWAFLRVKRWSRLTRKLKQNMTGFFVLPGRIDAPFTYNVRRIRDGGVYSPRSVEVYQVTSDESSQPVNKRSKGQSNTMLRQSGGTGRTPCFTATVSFKKREDITRFLGFKYQTPPLRPSVLEKHLRVFSMERNQKTTPLRKTWTHSGGLELLMQMCCPKPVRSFRVWGYGRST